MSQRVPRIPENGTAEYARDPLTGLMGRTECEALLDESVQRASVSGDSVSVAIVDIDLFGRVNRERGREAGDTLLRELGGAMVRHFGASATVSRFGGDAFAVLFEGMEKERTFLLLEAFRKGKEEEGGVFSSLTLSVGLASYPDDGVRAGDIVNKAGEALYRAKVTGRNRVCLAREEKMVTKTSHYMQGQLMGLRRLAEREGISDAVLLREALNDLLRKYNG
jgi:diguanylate cyclase (GGDEF)-like protein